MHYDLKATHRNGNMLGITGLVVFVATIVTVVLAYCI